MKPLHPAILLRNYDCLDWEKPDQMRWEYCEPRSLRTCSFLPRWQKKKRVRTLPRKSCWGGLINVWWSKWSLHHLLLHCQVGKPALGVRLGVQLKHTILMQGTDIKMATAIIFVSFKIEHKKTMSPMATSVFKCNRTFWQIAIQKNQSSLTQRWETALIWVSCRLLGI